MMFADMERGGGMATFTENRHTQGVMKIRCSTPASKSWLIAAVPFIQPLWEGMSLLVTDFNNLPKPKKY